MVLQKKGCRDERRRDTGCPLDELLQIDAAKFSGGGHDFQFSIEEDN